jgi:hypothetical protein
MRILTAAVIATLVATTASFTAKADDNLGYMGPLTTGLTASYGDASKVTVRNPDPVIEGKKTWTWGDDCWTSSFGSVQLLAFDGAHLLVEYTPSEEHQPMAENSCPTGTIFYMSKTQFEARLVADEKAARDHVRALLKH